MDKQKVIELRLTYNERATIGSSKRVEEFLTYVIDPDIEYMSDRTTEFKKALKKCFSLFNREHVYNIEFTLGYGSFYNFDVSLFARVYQSGADYSNGVYSLYTYSLTMPTTDIEKVSKQVALKRIFAMVDELTEKALTELREEATA